MALIKGRWMAGGGGSEKVAIGLQLDMHAEATLVQATTTEDEANM